MSASSSSNDLRNRILFTIFILAVYRFGTFVPLPGIDPEQLKVMMDGNQNWLKVLSGLKTFNNPKVINFKFEGKPVTTLNWGTHSEAGKDKNWGLSIGSDGDISFTTKDEIQSKLFEDAMGVENYYNKLNGSYSYMEEIDYSNPQDLVTKIKSIIKEFEKKKVGDASKGGPYAVATAMVKDKPEAAKKAYATIKAKMKEDTDVQLLTNLFNNLNEENQQTFLNQLEEDAEVLLAFAKTIAEE